MPGRLSRLRFQHWRYVDGLYRAAGVEPFVDIACLPLALGGCVYNDRRVALGFDRPKDVAMSLHDLAHLLVAPDDRQSLPNFGLGEHPGMDETATPAAVVTQAEADGEEVVAACVHVLLAYAVFAPGVARSAAAYMTFSREDVVSLHADPLGYMRRAHATPDARLLAERGVVVDRRFALPATVAAFVEEHGTMRARWRSG